MPSPKRKEDGQGKTVNVLKEAFHSLLGARVEQYDHDVTLQFIDVAEDLVDALDDNSENIKRLSKDIRSLKKSIKDLAAIMTEE